MPKGKGHELVEKYKTEPYRYMFRNSVIGELVIADVFKGHVDAAPDASEEESVDNALSTVTNVVTFGAPGPKSPEVKYFVNHSDAGTVE